jgi:hypothetical protein
VSEFLVDLRFCLLLLGGLSPEAGWKSLELLKKTMRRLKAAIAALD